MAIAVLASLSVWACDAPDRPALDGASEPAPAMAATGDEAALTQPHTLPPGAPDRFGFGTAAAAARVAEWDIDVKPDGEGLPAGSGTVTEGEVIYRTQCVACHGATGVEGPNDRLVSTAPWDEWPQDRSLGNYWPYATTLYDYIRRAMPQTTPGILSADETYAVIAYLLYLNDLFPEDGVLDAETLAAVEMPARDRFVPDDRRGGPEVR